MLSLHCGIAMHFLGPRGPLVLILIGLCAHPSVYKNFSPLSHLEGPAYCKWSSEGAGPLQMIIPRDKPIANDHLEGTASCKWSSRKLPLSCVKSVSEHKYSLSGADNWQLITNQPGEFISSFSIRRFDNRRQRFAIRFTTCVKICKTEEKKSKTFVDSFRSSFCCSTIQSNVLPVLISLVGEHTLNCKGKWSDTFLWCCNDSHKRFYYVLLFVLLVNIHCKP